MLSVALAVAVIVAVVAGFSLGCCLLWLALKPRTAPTPACPHKLEPRGEGDGEGDFVYCLDTDTAEPIRHEARSQADGRTPGNLAAIEREARRREISLREYEAEKRGTLPINEMRADWRAGRTDA